MNLKFWKKMPTQEDADDTAPGLFARMRTRVGMLTGRFKSPPPFQAEVAENENVSDSEQPQSGSRTKLIVGAGMLSLFLIGAIGFTAWKFLSAPLDEAESPQHPEEQLAITRPVNAPASEPAATEALSDAASQHEDSMLHPDGLPSSAPAITEHAKEDAFADEIVAASAAPMTSTHEAAASAVAQTHPRATVKPPPPSQTPETEIAKLRREKAELQQKLIELRNEKRHATAASRVQSGQTPVAGGSMTVPSSDPKATAGTLKTAIEAMNAGRGDYQKKPAK